MNFLSFIKQPFDPNGSVLNWALFVGLILVLIWIWAGIVGYIKPIAETAAEAV